MTARNDDLSRFVARLRQHLIAGAPNFGDTRSPAVPPTSSRSSRGRKTPGAAPRRLMNRVNKVSGSSDRIAEKGGEHG